MASNHSYSSKQNFKNIITKKAKVDAMLGIEDLGMGYTEDSSANHAL